MARRARLALRSPARLSSSRRLRRAATRANSAATKKALARTRASTAVSPRNTDTVCGGSIPEKVSVTQPPSRVAVPTKILAALVNGAALLGIAAWVVFEAFGRMRNPQPIRTGLFLGVAAVSLVANLVSLWVLHGARHGSLNVRGAYLHVMSDALGSVAAL